MRELVKELINAKISRRGFLAGMAAASYGVTAAKSALAAVEPFIPGSQMPEGYTRSVTGTGAEVMLEQILETDAKYLFIANGSGLGPICDALVERPGKLTLIQATHEGHVVSIADGYAKASGKTGFCMFSRVGLPNASSSMYNAMKDRSPLVVISDHASSTNEGTDTHEDLDDWTEAVKPYTKWQWVVHESERLAEWTRRAYKLSNIMPGGPTHIRVPRNHLYASDVTANVYSKEAFNVSMELRPDPVEIERAAKFLLESNSPLMEVGFEVSQCNAIPSVVELAELLALPVAQHSRSFHCDFPNYHPLHIGYLLNLPSYLQFYPHDIDCCISIGTRATQGMETFMRNRRIPLIHASVDPEKIGRNAPTAVGLLGDIDLIAKDLVEAIKSMASPAQLKRRTEERRLKISTYSAGKHAGTREAGRLSKGDPLPWQKLLYELDQLMEPDAVVVEELGRGERTVSHINFSPEGRLKIGRTTGMALGWGVGASVGTKLALPDRQVVSLQGDGGFMFGQSESLWSMSRYDVPILTIIINNRSYEATRFRIMGSGGAAGEAGRDYVSFLGDPDMDFAKLASVYNIPGEVVSNSDQVRPAIQRGFRTLKDGRPYMIDARTASWGTGAGLTQYQKFSVAQMRTKMV
ncbi:MAG: thiamine pyrophosphate-dependent acetolactate synthase large subunit-like protein [Gammaproteobacteria bacterium]|jgi:thiamine pyrophosphate-dependent acetolactate synthase large subunit-like protein